MNMALSDKQLQQFADDGYVLVRGLVDGATVARLQAETEALHAQMAAAPPAAVHVSWEEGLEEGRAPRIRQLMHSERVCPTIDAILRSNAMLAIIGQLVGPDVILYHSKLMMKAAHDGTFTPWHQDFGYWTNSSEDPSQINCMLGIDPQTIANGCIRFVPGSHKQGLIEHATFKSSSFSIGLEGDLDAFPDAVPVEFAPGDAVFFGPLVIHGSAPNTSALDRRANTFAFDKPDNWRGGGVDECLLLSAGQPV
jgi:ectoine hydroxylase-related dioxygenase (phytanoyl-CoA dioxygenase family)